MVFRKNIPDKTMKSCIYKPKILLFTSIDINAQDNLIFENFRSFLEEEKILMKRIIEKVLSLTPDVIFVHKNINRIAFETFKNTGITIFIKVNLQF